MFKKTILFSLLISAISTLSFAQSRVFTEVKKQISSKVEPIMQDNNLVGYILFTQLEQTSKDSFSYKLDFLDENLNDIGNYSFKDGNLLIQEAAFENDVLLIGYLRSDLPLTVNVFTYNKDKNKANSSIFFQFLSLNGTKIKEVSNKVELLFTPPMGLGATTKFSGSLKNSLRIQTIPGKGFSYSYGDGDSEPYVHSFYTIRAGSKKDTSSNETVGLFDFTGTKIWEKTLPFAKSSKLEIRAKEKFIYALRQTSIAAYDGGYEIFCLDAQNGNILSRKELKDKKDRQFDVVHFANTPEGDQTIISGTIINKKMENTSKYGGKVCFVKKPRRVGVFSLRMQDTSFVLKSTTWTKDAPSSLVKNDGLLNSTKTYLDLTHSFSDVNGNIYYVGSGIKKKTRWVSIGISVVTLPTFFVPYLLLGTGIFKYKYSQLLLLKENPEGKLAYYTNLKYDNSIFYPGQVQSGGIYSYTNKSFFSVNENKYLVLNDVKNIYIYNIESKNIIKTIPHQKGEIISNAFKAKDGFIMISEYNSREKSTKLSIESL